MPTTPFDPTVKDLHAPLTLDAAPTPRGFMAATFRDRSGARCSVQESSIDMPGGGLWLGVSVGPEGKRVNDGRMLLDRYMVTGLLPTLQRFAETGQIGQDELRDGAAPVESVEPDLVSFLVRVKKEDEHNQWCVSMDDGQASVDGLLFDDEEDAEDTADTLRGILSRLVAKVQSAKLVVKDVRHTPASAPSTAPVFDLIARESERFRRDEPGQRGPGPSPSAFMCSLIECYASVSAAVAEDCNPTEPLVELAAVAVRWLEKLHTPATPQASTLGTMSLERAMAITGQCLNHCTWHLFGEGEQPQLPTCTLEEMLIANRIVQNTPATPNPDGTSTLHCCVDPRAVAAEYALKEYGGPMGLLESLGYRLKPNAGE